MRIAKINVKTSNDIFDTCLPPDGKARSQSLVPTSLLSSENDSGARDLGFSCGRGLNCFSLLNRGETAHYLLSHIFGSIYPKRYCKSFHCGFCKAEHYKRWPLKGPMRILVFFGVPPGREELRECPCQSDLGRPSEMIYNLPDKCF